MWYLEHVGVDPDHQGGGIGSALVKFGLVRAAQDGIPACSKRATRETCPTTNA